MKPYYIQHQTFLRPTPRTAARKIVAQIGQQNTQNPSYAVVDTLRKINLLPWWTYMPKLLKR